MSSESGKNLLEVRQLSRSYGSLRAVDDISFTLDAGQVMGFIGPNGAGKSTTLRILATLDTPTSGGVFLDGKSMVESPDRVRPMIGYMPDRYGTYDDLTVAEFLDFFARAYGLKGAARRKRVEGVIEFTGLGPLADRLANSLSKGMKQRVALGRTLLNDPKLLILDEPADGLDPRARIELRELLRALADTGKAVLISSHILTELAEVCDTCAIIERGKLLATGPVDALVPVDSSGQAEPAAAPRGELRVQVVRSADVQESLARAERCLILQPGVLSVQLDGESVRVAIELPKEGGAAALDATQAALLRALVQENVPVCGLSRREANLEDEFLRVTRGRVA